MNKEELQGRYIEIFPSSADEMEYVLEKAERQANQPWENVVRLRGIPFKVNSTLQFVPTGGDYNTSDGVN